MKIPASTTQFTIDYQFRQSSHSREMRDIEEYYCRVGANELERLFATNRPSVKAMGR
jgi:hypothetical protein